jgi:hypothetical protein
MKEALKLALEALHGFIPYLPLKDKEQCEKYDKAITAIKAALAQPTSGDYALGYAEGFNDACKPKPAQEPVSVTYKEVADAMNSLWNGTLEQHQIAEQMANKKLYTTPAQPAQEPVAWMATDDPSAIETSPPHPELMHQWIPLYTTPQQRPWAGLTEAQFLEAVRLAENRNYLVAIQRIQEWLKEGNA